MAKAARAAAEFGAILRDAMFYGNASTDEHGDGRQVLRLSVSGQSYIVKDTCDSILPMMPKCNIWLDSQRRGPIQGSSEQLAEIFRVAHVQRIRPSAVVADCA